MIGVTLRPYQANALESLRVHVRAGKRRLLLVAPCGAGKTVMFSEVIRSFRERSGGAAIVIVHRSELVDQTLAKLSAVGVDAGVMMGADKRANAAAPVQVCSIQTLHRRKDRGLPPAGLVIYDEAHHAVSASAREVLALYPDAIIIGCTATPWRSDKVGLSDLFEDSVVAATPAQLVGEGALVRCEAFAYDAPDLHEAKIVAGDFSPKDLEIACNTQVLVGSVVREYQAHAAGRRAIVFPVSCEHSKALVKEFAASGSPARHIDWSTPKDERSAAIEDFRAGRVLVLSSVGVLSEGFDVPAAEICILARPTKSVSLFLQMAGRAMRPAPGKTTALIHDHSGNLFRHGFPEDERDYSLKATPQRTRDLMSCTDCGYMVSRWKPDGTCPKCGSIQAMPAEQREESERRRGKEHIDGRRLSRDEIERIRKEFSARGREVTREQAQKVARATRGEKAAEYLRLQQVAAEKGFRPGFVGHQYRATFGVWPRFSAEELAGVKPAEKPFLPLPPREQRSNIQPAVRG